jgi:hypothetical protein
MLAKPEAACFLIADISGYTSFLAGVELDHAQDIIADLMDTVVRCLRPPFRLAKFEATRPSSTRSVTSLTARCSRTQLNRHISPCESGSVTSRKPHPASARHATACNNLT